MRLGEERPGIPFKASIIQGNIEQDKKWETAYQNEVMDIYRDLSLRASSEPITYCLAGDPPCRLFLVQDKIYTEELMELQNQLGSPLLFGSVLIKGKKERPRISFQTALYCWMTLER